MVAGGGRAAWADFARGVSVVLVVLLHLYLLHYVFFFRGDEGADVVKGVIDATAPLRMPLFFLVSGFLAQRAIRRPWREAVHGRILQPAYLFLLWLLIDISIDTWRAEIGTGGEVNPGEYYLGNLLWPQTTLWYLYALVVFFVLTRLTRAVPAPIVLGVGVVVSIIGTTCFDGLAQSLLRSFVFFALAARTPQLIDAVVERVRAAGTSTAILLIVCAGAAYTAMTELYIVIWIDFGLYLAAGIAGVLFGIVLAVRVGAHPLTAPLRYLGRHTLAIFLVHPFVFILVNDLLQSHPWLVDAISGDTALMVAYPWALLAATLAVSVGFEALANLVRLRALFTLPRSPVRVSGP